MNYTMTQIHRAKQWQTKPYEGEIAFESEKFARVNQLKDCMVVLEELPDDVIANARVSKRYYDDLFHGSDTVSEDENDNSLSRSSYTELYCENRFTRGKSDNSSPRKTLVKKKKKLFRKENEKRLSMDDIANGAINFDKDKSVRIHNNGGDNKATNENNARIGYNNKSYSRKTTSINSYRKQNSVSSSSEDCSEFSCDESTLSQMSDDGGDNVLFKCDDEVSFNIPSSLVDFVTNRTCRSDAFEIDQRRRRKKRLYTQNRKRFSINNADVNATVSTICTRNEDLAAASLSLLSLGE